MTSLDLVGAIGLVVWIAAALWIFAAVSRAGRRSATRSTAAIWAKSSILIALFASIVVVALPLAAHRILPAPLPIPALVQTWGAAFLALVGVVGWIHCAHVFARRARGTPSPLDPPRRLITDGLYGVVRHPMEVSEMIVAWGVAFYLASAGAALYAGLLMVAFHLGVVRWEEPELRERFGESYEVYCRDVPRWLPRLHAIRSSQKRASR